jgi:nitroreductase
MTFDDLFQLLKERRSIRYFSDKPVDKALIDKILSAAILAPNVENTQPWRFHIIESPDLKTQMMGCSCYGNFVMGAGVFIVMVCDKSVAGKAPATIWNPKEMEYSCAVALHTAMLAATSLGLGSSWVSLHHGEAHNALHLPDHQIVVGGLMIGYPKDDEKEASGQHERKPIKDVVVYD